MYNRVRTKDGTSPWSFNVRRDYKGVSSTNTTYADNWKSGMSQTFWDISSSRFHRESNSGVIINNPMRSVKKTWSGSRGSRTMTYNGSAGTGQQIGEYRDLNNGVGSEVWSVPLDVSGAISEACTKALANIEAPTVESIPFIAELRSTLESFRNPLAGIRRAIDSYHRLRSTRNVSSSRLINGKPYTRKGHRGIGNRNGESIAKDLADQHLTLIYGIMPAIRDIEAGMKAISELSVRPKRKTARGSAQRTNVVAYTRTYNDGSVTGTINGVATRTVVVRAGSLYEVTFNLGLSKFGLTISDIPSAVLELLPFSFVVDWFVNLGTFVSAVTPVIGISRRAEWYTVSDTLTIQETLGSVTAIAANWTASGGGDQRTFTQTEVYRVPCNLGDHVSLQLNPDLRSVKENLAAILSLIIQRL
ncbi:MAG: maturation protein [Sanya solspi-like virus 4]|nr:MAG: maturation protein [Sanya solspi-like virus 4]